MIEVSIICSTYNQEKYIRDALESFVRQKTNFVFEVLVHDDASTDGTVDIIKEYEHKYPEIIKPIYQEKNQYSQKISIIKTYQLPRAQGKYIAICEGDDYWIDDYKLQKQYDALESHPNINICTCRIKQILGDKFKEDIAPSEKDIIFTPEEVILGGGGFVGTNSIMLRKKEFMENILYQKVMMLDYFMQIIGSIPGGMLYLNECMGIYRLSAVGSWTVRMNNEPESKIRHLQKVIENLQLLDKETCKRYSEAINRHIKEIEIVILMSQNNYNQILCDDFKNIYSDFSMKKKLKIRMKSLLQVVKDILLK